MRAFTRGQPFMDVLADDIVEGETELMPVFSETNLYPRMSKDDARFVLGVAEEYATLIKVMGKDKVKALLDDARKRGVIWEEEE